MELPIVGTLLIDTFKCAKSYLDLYTVRCDTNVVGDDIEDYIDINKTLNIKH